MAAGKVATDQYHDDVTANDEVFKEGPVVIVLTSMKGFHDKPNKYKNMDAI
jgi:hypothetical protein